MAAAGKTRRGKNVRARSSPRRAYLPAAERRKLIIAAAQEVFARANLQGARTRDIAKAAEVNQATIFEHFESKVALFHEAVVQPLIDAMRGVQERVEVYETAATPAELARLGQVSTMKHLNDMLQIFPLLTVALFSEPELGRKLYREEIAPLIRQRGEVLRPLVKEGIDPDIRRPDEFRHAFRRGDGPTSRRGERRSVGARQPVHPPLDHGIRAREEQGNHAGEKLNGSAT